MKKDFLIVVESSYMLKNYLPTIKIKEEDILNIHFIATNGSIFKYRNEKGKLLTHTLNQNIESRIKNFDGEVIIATDHDQNGDLIALECVSIRNDSKRFKLNIDDVFLKSKKDLILSKQFFLENSIIEFNLDNSLDFLVKKLKEEMETKEFYIKTGVKLSIDDRILLKIMKGNINHILNRPDWVRNSKNNNKDLYLYLASAIELNKDIVEVYEKSLKESDEGNLSYLRTDGSSHNFIQDIGNLKEESLKEILDYIIDIDCNKINKSEYEFITKNIFLLAKLYNVGTPATIFYIYKNAINNIDIQFDDDIDIKRRVNSERLNIPEIKIENSDFNIQKILNIAEKILNKNEMETDEEVISNSLKQEFNIN